MIIEVHSKIDSRFILYPFAYILSRMGTVQVITQNPMYHDFQGEQDMWTKYDDDGFIEQLKEESDYTILDNCVANRTDMILYFIDPYSGEDLTLIPKDAICIRVFKGIGKKKLVLKDTTLYSEEDLMLHTLLKQPCLMKMMDYEELYKFENINHFMNIDHDYLKAMETIKVLFKDTIRLKGGVNEHTSEKCVKVLW